MSFFPKQPSSRIGSTQTIAYDASVGATNKFGPGTFQLRLAASSACCYRIGDGAQTATIADVYKDRRPDPAADFARHDRCEAALAQAGLVTCG